MKTRHFMASCCLVALIGLLSTAAQADTILSVDGPDATGLGSSYPAYNVNIDAIAESWSSTNAYSDVSISAAVFSQQAGDTIQAWLVTQLGPTTTLADQVANTTVSLPNGGDAMVPLFSGLSLAANANYWLVLNSSSDLSGWYFTDNANISTGAGVTYGYDVMASEPPPPINPFWPANPFEAISDTTHSGRMLVTGDIVSTVPEPITLSLFSAGLAGAAAMRRRKKVLRA